MRLLVEFEHLSKPDITKEEQKRIIYEGALLACRYGTPFPVRELVELD